MDIMTNKPVDYQFVFQMLCASTGKWGVVTHFNTDYLDATYRDALGDLRKASNGRLTMEQDTGQCLLEGQAIFLFDTEQEMQDAYLDFVGDDGPTSRNSYSGKYRIYALTCGPDGQLLNENT